MILKSHLGYSTLQSGLLTLANKATPKFPDDLIIKIIDENKLFERYAEAAQALAPFISPNSPLLTQGEVTRVEYFLDGKRLRLDLPRPRVAVIALDWVRSHTSTALDITPWVTTHPEWIAYDEQKKHIEQQHEKAKGALDAVYGYVPSITTLIRIMPIVARLSAEYGVGTQIHNRVTGELMQGVKSRTKKTETSPVIQEQINIFNSVVTELLFLKG